MLDTFKRTMVACAAVGVFSGGAYVMGSGAVDMLKTRVEAVLAAQAKVSDGLVPINRDGN